MTTPRPIPKRALRIIDMVDRFKACREGYTVAELAELYQVSERTIQQDLSDLQGEGLYLPLVSETRWRLVG